MVDQVVDYAKSFTHSHQAIFEWHLLHSVLMMNGEEGGPIFCSIDLPVMAR
jgi:hypothetical protein